MRVRKVAAFVWVMVPPVLLSALIHTVDPDVGGVVGLASPGTLLSVLVWSLPAVLLALAGLGVAVALGWGTFAAVAVSGSATLALGLTLLQVRAPAPGDPWLPIGGGTLLVLLFIAVAVVPAAALGWPSRLRLGRASTSA
ncbi:MAG: hypothetical protein AB2L07_05375 [Thermoanaerobaculaceae bacterium]